MEKMHKDIHSSWRAASWSFISWSSCTYWTMLLKWSFGFTSSSYSPMFREAGLSVVRSTWKHDETIGQAFGITISSIRRKRSDNVMQSHIYLGWSIETLWGGRNASGEMRHRFDFRACQERAADKLKKRGELGNICFFPTACSRGRDRTRVNARTSQSRHEIMWSNYLHAFGKAYLLVSAYTPKIDFVHIKRLVETVQSDGDILGCTDCCTYICTKGL